MRIVMICPVRGGTPQLVENYVVSMEAAGHTVYFPPRDTPQDDSTGYDICLRMAQAIRLADEVRVWFDPASQGTLWDLGGAFILGKPMKLINDPEDIAEKSYLKVVKEIAAHS